MQRIELKTITYKNKTDKNQTKKHTNLGLENALGLRKIFFSFVQQYYWKSEIIVKLLGPFSKKSFWQLTV